MSNATSKVGSATLWSSITQVAIRLASPIVNMVLARLLAPEAFGIVATITMVITFAEVFTDAGFQKYIIQHEFKDEDELNKNTNVAFWTNFALSVLICIGIFIFRDQVAVIVGSPGLGNSISIASLLIILAAFSSIQMARFRRDMDFKSLFFVRFGAAIIPFVVTIPLALMLKNYWALIIGNIASNLFTAVVLTIKSRWKPAFFYDFKMLKEMFSFSAWSLLESITVWITANAGIFIIGSQLDDYHLGLYKTATSMVSACMAIIYGSITPVLFSTLSRLQDNELEFKETFYKFNRMSSVVLIPLGFGILVFRKFVTLILLGEQWMEISDFIGYLGLGLAFVASTSYLASEVFRAKGKPVVSVIHQTIYLLFIIPSLIISIGVSFECLTIVRSLLTIEMVISAIVILKFFGFKIRTLLLNLVPSTISAIVMGIVGYLLLLINDAWWWNVISVLICIVVYFLFLFLVFPKTRKEILEIELVKKVLAKFSKKTKTGV